MARGIPLKHVRKAGAFVDGELYAGEWGLDVSNDKWFYSLNGTTVKALGTTDVPGASALNDLSDVALASLAEGNLLSYDATNGTWINRTAVQAGLVPLTQKGVSDGVATLGSDGKIPAAQLPALALTSVSVVNTLAERDALTVQSGDVAIVLNEKDTFIYDGTQWREYRVSEAHTHDAADIVSGSLASARMTANVGAALNASSAVTLNNPSLIIDAGTL